MNYRGAASLCGWNRGEQGLDFRDLGTDLRHVPRREALGIRSKKTQDAADEIELFAKSKGAEE